MGANALAATVRDTVYLGSHLRENGMMLALVAIVLFFFIMVRATQGVDFLSAQNITNLFLQNSYVIIMALGMLLVIVAGHIDLSVGSVLGLAAVGSAVLMVEDGLGVWATVAPAATHSTEMNRAKTWARGRNMMVCAPSCATSAWPTTRSCARSW